MRTPPTTFVATCDLAGHTRGRAVPADATDAVLREGLGWVPANLALNGLGNLVSGTPFGSTGDLRLRPDPISRTEVPARPGTPAVTVLLADETQVDGADWDCCPRTGTVRQDPVLHRRLGPGGAALSGRRALASRHGLGSR